jgi:hypothetical protein
MVRCTMQGGRTSYAVHAGNTVKLPWIGLGALFFEHFGPPSRDSPQRPAGLRQLCIAPFGPFRVALSIAGENPDDQ